MSREFGKFGLKNFLLLVLIKQQNGRDIIIVYLCIAYLVQSRENLCL